MANITVRELDDLTKQRLRVRAARHGRSMEAEARAILQAAVQTEEPAQLHPVAAIRRRMAAVGGVKLALPRRAPMPEPPELG